MSDSKSNRHQAKSDTASLSCLPIRRLLRGALLGLISALAIGIAPAVGVEGETPLQQRPVTTGEHAMPSTPESVSPWIDAVRAQRQAWEARRNAAREDFETRRRINLPHSAARQETWEQDLRLRRATRRGRIEHNRERLRNLTPGQPPMNAPGHSAPSGETTADSGPPFAPPGWDNHWYFRGF